MEIQQLRYFLAAEALQQAAQARGLTLKVETNGAAGVNDELTDDEIQAAECVTAHWSSGSAPTM